MNYIRAKKHVIQFTAFVIAGGILAVGISYLSSRSSSFTFFNNPETVVVKVYYGNGELDPELACDRVFPVARTIPVSSNIKQATLEAQLLGPTPEEKKAGYFTSINPGVGIKSLDVENNTAYVDLTEEVDEDVAGACRVIAIQAEIAETLKQFTGIDKVIISVRGESETILQP